MVGKYPPHYTDTDVKTFVTALVNLQQDSVAAVPADASIDMELAKTSVGERGSFFRELLDFCNAEISKCVLGGTLTQEVGQVGSYAAAQTHQDVRQDIIESDATLLEATLDSTLVAWLVDFNYGPDITKEFCPSFKLNVAPSKATKEYADTLVSLSNAGLQIPVKHVRETFGIPEPRNGEETLKPTISATPMFRENHRFFEHGRSGR